MKKTPRAIPQKPRDFAELKKTPSFLIPAVSVQILGMK